MRRLLLASCLALVTLTSDASPSDPASPDIASVLASPTRSAEDRERDAHDKAAEVLALAGFKQGQTVADILGGGHYSEIRTPRSAARLIGSCRCIASADSDRRRRMCRDFCAS